MELRYIHGYDPVDDECSDPLCTILARHYSHQPDPWPNARTIDGYPVVPGMWVWDYNLRLSQVTSEQPSEDHGVWWFRTTGGMFDGSRMWRRHPTTHIEAQEGAQS